MDLAQNPDRNQKNSEHNLHIHLKKAKYEEMEATAPPPKIVTYAFFTPLLAKKKKENLMMNTSKNTISTKPTCCVKSLQESVNY